MQKFTALAASVLVAASLAAPPAGAAPAPDDTLVDSVRALAQESGPQLSQPTAIRTFVCKFLPC